MVRDVHCGVHHAMSDRGDCGGVYIPCTVWVGEPRETLLRCRVYDLESTMTDERSPGQIAYEAHNAQLLLDYDGRIRVHTWDSWE